MFYTEYSTAEAATESVTAPAFAWSNARSRPEPLHAERSHAKRWPKPHISPRPTITHHISIPTANERSIPASRHVPIQQPGPQPAQRRPPHSSLQFHPANAGEHERHEPEPTTAADAHAAANAEFKREYEHEHERSEPHESATGVRDAAAAAAGDAAGWSVPRGLTHVRPRERFLSRVALEFNNSGDCEEWAIAF